MENNTAPVVIRVSELNKVYKLIKPRSPQGVAGLSRGKLFTESIMH